LNRKEAFQKQNKQIFCFQVDFSSPFMAVFPGIAQKVKTKQQQPGALIKHTGLPCPTLSPARRDRLFHFIL